MNWDGARGEKGEGGWTVRFLAVTQRSFFPEKSEMKVK